MTWLTCEQASGYVCHLAGASCAPVLCRGCRVVFCTHETAEVPRCGVFGCRSFGATCPACALAWSGCSSCGALTCHRCMRRGNKCVTCAGDLPGPVTFLPSVPCATARTALTSRATAAPMPPAGTSVAASTAPTSRATEAPMPPASRSVAATTPPTSRATAAPMAPAGRSVAASTAPTSRATAAPMPPASRSVARALTSPASVIPVTPPHTDTYCAFDPGAHATRIATSPRGTTRVISPRGTARAIASPNAAPVGSLRATVPAAGAPRITTSPGGTARTVSPGGTTRVVAPPRRTVVADGPAVGTHGVSVPAAGAPRITTSPGGTARTVSPEGTTRVVAPPRRVAGVGAPPVGALRVPAVAACAPRITTPPGPPVSTSRNSARAAGARDARARGGAARAAAPPAGVARAPPPPGAAAELTFTDVGLTRIVTTVGANDIRTRYRSYLHMPDGPIVLGGIVATARTGGAVADARPRAQRRPIRRRRLLASMAPFESIRARLAELRQRLPRRR